MHQPWRRGWPRRRGRSGGPGRPSSSPATPTYYILHILHILHIPPPQLLRPPPEDLPPPPLPPRGSAATYRKFWKKATTCILWKRFSLVLLESRRSHNWKVTWWKCKTRTRRQTRRDSRNMFLDFFFFCRSNLLVSHRELNFCTLAVVGWSWRGQKY